MWALRKEDAMDDDHTIPPWNPEPEDDDDTAGNGK